MKTVLLEWRLPQPPVPGHAPLPHSAGCCTPELVSWCGSYVTADRRRAYLLAQAADLETVRHVLRPMRHNGVDIRWMYEVEDTLLTGAMAPNVAIELFTEAQVALDDIERMVRTCAPGSAPLRILREKRGGSVLLLANTQCRRFGTPPGVTMKSIQPLQLAAPDRFALTLNAASHY